MCGYCGDGWRFETTVLGGPDGGRVKGVLHPVSAEWEEGYSRPATGSLVVATRDPAAEDVWPGATGLYISQVMPDGSRRCRFGGYIENFSGAGGGATTLGLKSVDTFLEERLIAGGSDPWTLFCYEWFPPATKNGIELYKPTGPTTETKIFGPHYTDGGTAGLAAFLVRLAQGNILGGTPVGLGELTATYQAPYSELPPNPGGTHNLRYNWWDFKNIGQAIRELVEAEDGIKYQLDHYFNSGYWNSVMTFSDVIGTVRDYVLKSDREGWQYGLQVDAADKTTRVYGVGQGSEWATMYSIAYDADGVDNLPERQSTTAWKDQANPATLDAQTKGVVTDHRDPTTIPSMTVVGMPDYDSDAAGFDPRKGFPAPEICRPGDTFGVDIGYGLITVKDIQVRNLGVAWSLKEGAPVERTIAMQPVIRANDSVRTQTPTRPPAPQLPVTQTPTGTADPWPTPGKVSNIQTADLTEISGLEVNRSTVGGYVWVLEDEFETPDQVSAIRLKTGERVGWFTPTPSVSAAPVGDPESLRYSVQSKKLVIADTGDNDLDRPTSGANQPHLLAVTEPSPTFKGTVAATKYPIAYPGGARYNVEALLIHPLTDEVFLMTKEATKSQVFSYGPLSAMSTVNNVGTLVATLTGVANVSDATHVRLGGFILVRAHVQATVVYNSSWQKVGSIPTPAMSKCEAIAYNTSCDFYVTTEGENPPIYRVLIPKAFGATCATPAGPGSTGGTTPPPVNSSATVPGQVIPMTYWKLQLPI